MTKVKDFNWFLKLIIPKDFIGITLYPFGVYIQKGHQTERVINHENIHLVQQKEMFVLFFYFLYIGEWMFKGYRKISFEKEAKLNERNPRYLEFRKPFAWKQYL